MYEKLQRLQCLGVSQYVWFQALIHCITCYERMIRSTYKCVKITGAVSHEYKTRLMGMFDQPRRKLPRPERCSAR